MDQEALELVQVGLVSRLSLRGSIQIVLGYSRFKYNIHNYNKGELQSDIKDSLRQLCTY